MERRYKLLQEEADRLAMAKIKLTENSKDALQKAENRLRGSVRRIHFLVSEKDNVRIMITLFYDIFVYVKLHSFVVYL